MDALFEKNNYVDEICTYGKGIEREGNGNEPFQFSHFTTVKVLMHVKILLKCCDSVWLALSLSHMSLNAPARRI